MTKHRRRYLARCDEQFGNRSLDLVINAISMDAAVKIVNQQLLEKFGEETAKFKVVIKEQRV